jgi:hypothetical protein
LGFFTLSIEEMRFRGEMTLLDSTLYFFGVFYHFGKWHSVWLL